MLPKAVVWTVHLSVMAVLFGCAVWAGLQWGAWAFFLSWVLLGFVHLWIFPKLPEIVPPTEAERQAKILAWEGFFDRLLWPVGPLLLAGWLLMKWLDSNP
jgi:hypothetical protein